MFQNALLIAAGGALGTLCRYGLAEAFAAWLGPNFPWGTVFINISGSFLAGFFGTLTGPDGRLLVPGIARQFILIGFCGGYTTFSSFSLQTLNMAQDGRWMQAGLNVVMSVAMCLIAVWLGAAAGQMFNQLKGA